jgi:hypothetical protein
MHATDNATLSAAMRTLADVIDAPDGTPALAMREAADRIVEGNRRPATTDLSRSDDE